MTENTNLEAPARGEFRDRHFSWLCQAGQGKCQRGDDYELRLTDRTACTDLPEES